MQNSNRVTRKDKRLQRKLARELKQWQRERDQSALLDSTATTPTGYGLRPSDQTSTDWFTSVKVRQDEIDLLTTQQSYDATNTNGVTLPNPYQKYKKWCKHGGNVPVLAIGKCLVYGAAYYDLPTLIEAELIIDCANLVDTEVLRVPEAYASLQQFTSHSNADVIKIDWNDHGVPPVSFGFWEELYGLLPDGKVIICCFGGHGRTGTALAALAIIDGKLSGQEAVDLIHKQHCTQAVETASQRRYLVELGEWWSDRCKVKAGDTRVSPTA